MKMPADVNSKVLEKPLCKRLPILSNHFADMRRGLDRAVGAYNRAVGSFEERVLVPAGRFKDWEPLREMRLKSWRDWIVPSGLWPKTA